MFGKLAIHWFTKLSFDDTTIEARITFSLGDFIKYHGSKTGRIQRILIHRMDEDSPRAFVLVNHLTTANAVDAATNSRIFSLEMETDLVGLPAIDPMQLYVVPFRKNDTEWTLEKNPTPGDNQQGFLLVNYDFKFM